MIVRIATEGQYELPEDQLERLNELDDAVVGAVESGSDEQFHQRYRELLDQVRAGGQLDDEDLGPSDLILPPPDLSLEEASREFTGDRLIPD
jgi:hypothetical protein